MQSEPDMNAQTGPQTQNGAYEVPSPAGVSAKAADSAPLPPRVEIFASKPKLFFLLLPCLLAAVICVHSGSSDRFLTAEFTWPRIVGLLMALGVAAHILRVVFERQPIIVIDHQGIYCRRPPVGTVEWTAVTALGSAKGTMMRRLLLVAADPDRLGAQPRAFADRTSGFATMLSPTLARFRQQTRGSINLHIPISLLSVSPSRIERLVRAYGKFHIAERNEPHE